MEMKVVEETNDMTHVALVGRLDVEGVKQIEAHFETYVTSRNKPTIVDLSQVPFMSSLGMRLLLRCAKSLKAAGCKMALLKPQQLVHEALKMASLDQIFGIVEEKRQALQFLWGA